jgi:hypothetical protein
MSLPQFSNWLQSVRTTLRGLALVSWIEVRNKKGDVSKAVLELRYRRIRVLPPIGKQKLYPELRLTVLYATEFDPPKGREPVDWKLVTDLLVRSRADAIEKHNWYAMLW